MNLRRSLSAQLDHPSGRCPRAVGAWGASERGRRSGRARRRTL